MSNTFFYAGRKILQGGEAPLCPPGYGPVITQSIGSEKYLVTVSKKTINEKDVEY